MKDGYAVLLVHMDYGYDEHGYMLYAVPEDRLEAAGKTLREAWDTYDATGRQAQWEDAAENALKSAGIPFECVTYDPVRIEA